MERETRKGTTTIGLLGKDGVVLASETRATMGTMIANKEVEKVFKIQDHLGMTTAGSVADAQKLVRTLQVETNLYQIERKETIKVEAAATLLANILQENRWFPYWVQLLLGGYDSKPRLYSLDAVGSMIEEKVVSTGSGSPFAYGVLENKYKEGQPTDENVKLAVEALRAAMERDAMSGNGINVIKITKKGYEKVDTSKYLKK
ncbi:MAG: archaeal proteasome endopeptidase complex subunit beta [Candidatus Diapherotrites archaeon]|nr:archaeal proteasome endopeptidase complex subunit beta [Candidatus Diapherotrites archaeon]